MIAVVGLLFILAGIFSYLVLIFVLHRFTYRTWMFDVSVGVGMALAMIGWANRCFSGWRLVPLHQTRAEARGIKAVEAPKR